MYTAEKLLAGAAQLTTRLAGTTTCFAFAQLPFNDSAARPLQGPKTKNACEQQPRFSVAHLRAVDEEQFSFQPRQPFFVIF